MAAAQGPRTVQADLDQFGFSHDKIKNRLDSMRYYTISEVHINDEFCDKYGWSLHNSVLGPGLKASDTPVSSQSMRCLQHYDNSANKQDATVAPTDNRSNSLHQFLVMEKAAKIKLDTDILLPRQLEHLDLPPALAGDWGDPQIGSADSNSSMYNEDYVPLQFELKVAAGEVVDLWKMKSQTGSVTIWEVPYGFKGMVGSHGTVWNDSEDWGFGFDAMFPDPLKLTISLRTELTKVTYVLQPGQYQTVPFHSADWHPISTVVVTNKRTNVVREYHLGEIIDI